MKIIPQFLFITGSAGSGKTHFIRTQLAMRYKLTATTGPAAVNMGLDASTVNSALGYGVEDNLHPLRSVIYSNLLKIKRENYVGIVIDEISMMKPDILQVIREESIKAGLELIVVGDFAQLPPVTPGQPYPPFAFEAPCWRDVRTKILPQIGDEHKTRQNGDPVFYAALNELRKSENDQTALDLLLKAGVRFTNSCDINFSGLTLFARNDRVDAFNDERYRNLVAPSVRFKTVRKGVTDAASDVPEHIDLKMGAQVRATTNCWEDGYLKYTNGDTGIIAALGLDYADVFLHRTQMTTRIPYFVRKKEINMRTVVRTRENDETYLVRVGDEIGRIIYMPLELGWASTVHKAQGITAFSGIQAFVGGMSTGGTMYVVASRCKRGQDLILIGTPQEFLRNCKAFGKVHRAGYLDLESLRKTI